MKLTERRSNGKLTTWIYEDESLRSVEAAAGRIAYAAALEGFEPKYIALRDLEHSVDEGSDSRELRADAGKNEILAALAAKSCDRLFLSGKYQDVRVGVTIDQKSFGLSITLPEERIDAMEPLANSLDGDVRQSRG